MKSKIKRLVPVLLSVLMCGSLFAGCTNTNTPDGDEPNPPPPGHQHSYTGWQDNGDGTHSPKCSGSTDPECNAPVKTEEKENHDYGTGTTCTKCGNVKTEQGGETGDKDTSVALPAANKIYLVGDSTVCSYIKEDGSHTDKSTYYVVRYGYGTQMAEYLNVTSDQVVNLALSGRSSKSFLSEANYTTLKTSISEGDYLIIGFGHNDEKTDMNFYTNANLATTDSSTTQGSSFKYTLYENYVKLAQEAKATPILCTPIVRQNPKNDYTGSSAHVTSDKEVLGVTYKGGDYPQAIRDLAAEKNVALVDLTEITKTLYSADNDGALKYHAYNSYQLDADGVTKVPFSPDTTHLNELGAKMVAYQFAQALKNTECPLKAQVKSLATAPTDADFKDRVNNDFVKPTASAFDPSKDASAIWNNINVAGWYGSVFGSIGGQTKINTDNFELSGTGNTFKIDCKTGNGKFASTEEGMAAIFMQIDATKDFTAEATATLTGTGDNQSSFGLMLRDDMFIDKNDKTIKSNYISAGLLNGDAIFMRKDDGSRVVSGEKVAITDKAVYNLKIVKSGDNITVSVTNGGTTHTKTYTSTEVSLVTSDPQNVYLCLYAIRNICVDFTNVNVEVSD